MLKREPSLTGVALPRLCRAASESKLQGVPLLAFDLQQLEMFLLVRRWDVQLLRLVICLFLLWTLPPFFLPSDRSSFSLEGYSILVLLRLQDGALRFIIVGHVLNAAMD